MYNKKLNHKKRFFNKILTNFNESFLSKRVLSKLCTLDEKFVAWTNYRKRFFFLKTFIWRKTQKKTKTKTKILLLFYLW